MGFGAVIVKKFVSEGCKVVVMDVKEAPVPDGAMFHKSDIRDLSSWEAALKLAIDNFGGVDILINNAAIMQSYVASHDFPQTLLDDMFEINVKPLFTANRVLVPHFLQRGHQCVVVNLSSSTAEHPRPGFAIYCASKGAVSAATKAFAIEYAPNIRFVAIAPALGNTQMFTVAVNGNDSEEMKKMAAKNIPIGRLTEPADIANTACFLASDEAEFICGAIVLVDGGRSL